MSGRNRAEQLDGGDDVALLKSEGLVGEGDAMDVDAVTGGAGEVAAGAKKAEMAVPAMRGWADETEADKEGKGLEMEWWDEAFLTKETRDQKVQLIFGPFVGEGGLREFVVVCTRFV